MPQFNFATFVSQAFWLIISFSLMLILMKYVIVPRFSRIMDLRKHHIENYIKKAEKLQEEAKSSLQKYDKIIDTAKADANENLQRAKEELDNFIKEQTEIAAKDLQNKMRENEEFLNEQRQEAYKLALQAAEKISVAALQQLGLEHKTLADVQKISKNIAEEEE